MASLLNPDVWLAPRYGWSRADYERARLLHRPPDAATRRPPSVEGSPVAVGAFLAAIGSSTAWHADALCREHPELDWFRPRDEAAARAVCASCLVRQECLAAALAGREAGVWGGLSERERAKVRRAAA